jgi:cell division septation protein DedD
MASHKLKIVYDDATGTVTMSHRCTVEVAGVAVGSELPIDPPAGVAESCRTFLDLNRAEVEAEANAAAVQHVAALAGKRKAGVKTLKVGGSLGSGGASEATMV